MNTSITRKCFKCKQDIVIDENSIDDAIYFDKKTWHKDCFINAIPKKQKSTSKNVREVWKEADNLDSIQSDSHSYLLAYLYKETVYNFIRNKYNITVVPDNVFIRLKSIYEGTYKGMSEGIRPDILLDMWERKFNYLNKIYNKKKSEGKVFNNTIGRVFYDLSVLVNKYDSYKEFIEKQKIMASEAVENIQPYRYMVHL